MSTNTISPPLNAILFPDTSRKWTFEDVKDWGEDVYCEILEGELFMSPTPTFYHQEVSLNLAILLKNFIKSNDLGRICTAPQDVRLSPTNLLQPDILFISKSNSKAEILGSVIGPPDLVVEVISPSSIRRDYHQKMKIYSKFGISEYWIVDPANRVVEVFVLTDENEYELFFFNDDLESEAESKCLPGFKAKLKDIFQV